MGRLAELLFGAPPPLPPLEDERAKEVLQVLLNHHATVNSRSPINSMQWQRWARELAGDIVVTVVQPHEAPPPPHEHPDLRVEFQARLVDLANEFDHRDHEQSSDGAGTDLQEECQRTREFARSLAAEREAAQRAKVVRLRPNE
jgi:hypothetical protein